MIMEFYNVMIIIIMTMMIMMIVIIMIMIDIIMIIMIMNCETKGLDKLFCGILTLPLVI